MKLISRPSKVRTQGSQYHQLSSLAYSGILAFRFVYAVAMVELRINCEWRKYVQFQSAG